MKTAATVYAALRSFGRPATVAELVRESGLDRDQVHNALRTLRRDRTVLVDVDAPRCRGLYQLAPGAPLPKERRGRYERTPEIRQRNREALALVAWLPMAPPAGAPRLVFRGVLDCRRPERASERHELDALWPWPPV